MPSLIYLASISFSRLFQLKKNSNLVTKYNSKEGTQHIHTPFSSIRRAIFLFTLISFACKVAPSSSMDALHSVCSKMRAKMYCECNDSVVYHLQYYADATLNAMVFNWTESHTLAHTRQIFHVTIDEDMYNNSMYMRLVQADVSRFGIHIRTQYKRFIFGKTIMITVTRVSLCVYLNAAGAYTSWANCGNFHEDSLCHAKH